MSDLTDFWATWTADVNDPPAPSQTEATDSLQLVAPTLTDQQGDDWFVAVATEYERLGIINQTTYVALRNEVSSSGEVASNDLFIALQAAILALPETTIVTTALRLESDTQEFNGIPADIVTIETARDLLSDQVLIDAYNAGIVKIQEREAELKAALGL